MNKSTLRILGGLVAIFYVFQTQVSAQFVTIPDAEFASYLSLNLPNCMSGNQLDTTCVDIQSFFSVNVSSSMIVTLEGVQYLDSVKTLLCNSSSSLTTIPPLPPRLVEFDCSLSTGLTTLPPLPLSLEKLDCRITFITSLPALPIGLKYLDCSTNSDVTLPTSLPPGLEVLICGDISQTQSLPPLPASLVELDCWGIGLVSLPDLPAGLQTLIAYSNNLGIFGDFPISFPPNLEVLDVRSNQLPCLPFLPSTITQIQIDGNPLSCLPNYLPAMSAATISNLPLCVVGDMVNNPNNCNNGIGINGLSFEDGDGNCELSVGEFGLGYIPLKLFDASNNLLGTTFSTSTGGYYFSPTAGDYKVRVDLSNKPYLQASCALESQILLTPVSPVVSGVDFGIECNGFDVGGHSISRSGWVFPGQTHQVRMWAGDVAQVHDFSCASSISGQVNVTVNGPVSYVAPIQGALTPAISGNTYSYVISDFAAVNFQTDFGLQLLTNMTAQASDSVCVILTVSAGAGDVNPGNNTLEYCYEVTNSYDPNEKEVFPKQLPAASTDWITYTIHFQNTGNAPAFNVRLEDSLPSNLNFESFELLSFSNQNVTSLKADGLLIVQFPNILLPDSTSDPEGSQGWFQFRIKPLAEQPLGTVISNAANIFFDFNPPILTDSAQTVFDGALSINSPHHIQQLKVYPNPGNGLFQVDWVTHLSGEPVLLEIKTLTGEILEQINLNGLQGYQLDLQKYTEGMYILKLTSGNHEKYQKLMLMK